MMANVHRLIVHSRVVAGPDAGILMMVTVACFAHKNKWGRRRHFSGSRFGRGVVELAWWQTGRWRCQGLDPAERAVADPPCFWGWSCCSCWTGSSTETVLLTPVLLSAA
jgi:hypothetical protein